MFENRLVGCIIGILARNVFCGYHPGYSGVLSLRTQKRKDPLTLSRPMHIVFFVIPTALNPMAFLILSFIVTCGYGHDAANLF